MMWIDTPYYTLSLLQEVSDPFANVVILIWEIVGRVVDSTRAFLGLIIGTSSMVRLCDTIGGYIRDGEG